MPRIPGREPATDLKIRHDGLWMRVMPDDSEWMPLGICPRPVTRWRWLVHDICHGLLMEYNVLSVLAYSIRHWIEGEPD